MTKLIAALALVFTAGTALAAKDGGPQIVSAKKPAVLKTWLKTAEGVHVAAGKTQWFLARVGENKSAFKKVQLDPKGSPAPRIAFWLKGTKSVSGIKPGTVMIIRRADGKPPVGMKLELPGGAK